MCVKESGFPVGMYGVGWRGQVMCTVRVRAPDFDVGKALRPICEMERGHFHLVDVHKHVDFGY